MYAKENVLLGCDALFVSRAFLSYNAFVAIQDNKYFGYGAQTALVVANSDQNRMVFRRTVFDNNNMEFNNTSVRVELSARIAS